MKRQIQSSGSGLFLLELLLAVFLFILSAAVCLWLFASADRINREAEEQDQALFLAQSVAGQLRSGTETLRSSQPQAVWSEDGCTLSYDRDWEACSPEEAEYVLTVEIRQEGQEQRAEICVERVQPAETIYRQEFVQHLPYDRAGTGGAA